MYLSKKELASILGGTATTQVTTISNPFSTTNTTTQNSTSGGDGGGYNEGDIDPDTGG